MKAEDCSAGQAAASFQAGDAVKVRNGVTGFATGESMASWVRTATLYVIQAGDEKTLVSSTRRRGHRVDQDGRSCKSVKEDTMDTEIIVALLALLGTLAGSGGGVIISSKLTNYRLEQLENGWRSTTIMPAVYRWWRSKSG